MKGITICEGDFEDVVEFDTQAELDAFSRGFNEGANKYGAGSAFVLTRADLGGMSAKCDALIQEHLPE